MQLIELLYVFLISIVSVLMFFSFVMISTNFKNYKYYKISYDLISSYKYIYLPNEYSQSLVYKKKDQVLNLLSDPDYKYIAISVSQITPKIEITSWGTIILTNGGRITKSYMNYFDPYTLYYYNKFKKWFDEHGGIEYTINIERDNKLEELLK